MDAVVIIGQDRIVKAFSKAAEALFRYQAEEVVGRNVAMLMPEEIALKHDAFVQRYLDTGERRIIGIGREVMARRKDGALIPVYLSVGEGRDDAGQRFFVGILHDLTREKDTIRRMRELAAIVDSTGDAVLGLTLDGLVTYWNKGAEELYGYPAREAIGASALTLVAPREKRRELEEVLTRIRQNPASLRLEAVQQDRAGKRLAVSLTVSPILDASGAVTGASAIARDITARRAAEKAQAEARRAAEESNRVKTDFLKIVSHELRTPLTVIMGSISLLTDHDAMPGPEEAAAIAQDIEDSASRLMALINDLIDISEMEAGQAVLRLAPVEAQEMALEVAQALEPLAQAKGLTLELETEPAELMADPLRLKQALTNLGDNAVKFTASGTVTLACYRTGKSVLFEVRDTGQGIPDDQIKRIFDAFHQGDTSDTRAAQGTGLGLTIVRRIVELHGGVVNVESEPGVGSAFLLALPVEGPAVRGGPALQEPASPG